MAGSTTTIIVIVIIVVVLAAALLVYFFVIRKKPTPTIQKNCTAPPAKPTNFKITNQTAQNITLTWDAQADAKSYTINSDPNQANVIDSGTVIYSELASAGTSTTTTSSRQETLYYVLQVDNDCGTTNSDIISHDACVIDDPQRIDNTTWFKLLSHSNNSSGTILRFDISAIPDAQFPLTVNYDDIQIFALNKQQCIRATGEGSFTIPKGATYDLLIAHGDVLNPPIAGNCRADDLPAIPTCSTANNVTNSWVARMMNGEVTNVCGLTSDTVGIFSLGTICPE